MRAMACALMCGIASSASASVAVFNPHAGVLLNVSESVSVVSMTDRSITVAFDTPTLSVTSDVRTRVDVARDVYTSLTPVINPGNGLMQVLITEQVEFTLDYSVDRGAAGAQAGYVFWLGNTTASLSTAPAFEFYSSSPVSGTNTRVINTPGVATNPDATDGLPPQLCRMNFWRSVYAISDGGGGSASVRDYLTFRFRVEIREIPAPSAAAVLALGGVVASRRRRNGS